MVPGTTPSMGRFVLPNRGERHMVSPTLSKKVRTRRIPGQKSPEERPDRKDRNTEGGLVFGPPTKSNDDGDRTPKYRNNERQMARLRTETLRIPEVRQKFAEKTK